MSGDSRMVQIELKNRDVRKARQCQVIYNGPHKDTVVCYVPLDYYSVEEARAAAVELLAEAQALEDHLSGKEVGHDAPIPH